MPSRTKQLAVAGALVAAAAVAFMPAAQARGFFSLSIGVPGVVVGAPYYAPPPVYVAPRPVYVAPPVVYARPRVVYYAPRARIVYRAPYVPHRFYGRPVYGRPVYDRY